MKKAQQASDDLKMLYSSTFGGKSTGRFKISREDFKVVTGRSTLQPGFIAEVMAHAVIDHSLVLLELNGGTYFGVIEVDKVLGWRTVPDRLIQAKFVTPQ
jgi:hypothetical protein